MRVFVSRKTGRCEPREHSARVGMSDHGDTAIEFGCPWLPKFVRSLLNFCPWHISKTIPVQCYMLTDRGARYSTRSDIEISALAADRTPTVSDVFQHISVNSLSLELRHNFACGHKALWFATRPEPHLVPKNMGVRRFIRLSVFDWRTAPLSQTSP